MNSPTTTTTSTSSTTTTTTSTSSTTTTTTTLAPLDCALNGGSAVIEPVPSNISADGQEGVDCNIDTPNIVYIDQQNLTTLTAGDIVYTNVGQTNVFLGGSLWWKIAPTGTSDTFSARITDAGVVLATITICTP